MIIMTMRMTAVMVTAATGKEVVVVRYSKGRNHVPARIGIIMACHGSD